MRVLLVEDDPDIRRSMCEYLDGEGFDMVLAHDGEHALRLAAAARPDIIVLDLFLPGVDGAEFAERWRGRAGKSQVPIVAMSGLPEGAQLAERLGAVEFRAKPLDLAELADLLRALIARKNDD